MDKTAFVTRSSRRNFRDPNVDDLAGWPMIHKERRSRVNRRAARLARCRFPSYRFRLLLIGLVYGAVGAMLGALLAIAIGWPALCILVGAAVGAALGVRLEAS